VPQFSPSCFLSPRYSADSSALPWSFLA
jgi:hypothetical protein